MSCDHELANEWAHCSGKNASYITIVDTVGVLEGYKEEYLWQVCPLHPNESGIPKMHSLVHSPITYVQVSIYNIYLLQNESWNLKGLVVNE